MRKAITNQETGAEKVVNQPHLGGFDHRCREKVLLEEAGASVSNYVDSWLRIVPQSFLVDVSGDFRLMRKKKKDITCTSLEMTLGS